MIHRFRDITPVVDETAFIAEGAHVIGDVVIGPDTSVWFGSVLRGDVHRIRVGARTNIQDLTVIHVNEGTHPTTVEDSVTIGHRAIIHGCTVRSGALIGMGAVLLDDVVVEEEAFVAAGSVVSPGTIVPARKLARGTPARIIRELADEELDHMREASKHYCELKDEYARQRRES